MDDQGKLLGLLSSTNIIQGYMDDWDSEILKKAHTPIENVVDTLAAKALYLNENLRRIQGTVHIVSMTTNGAMNYIEENVKEKAIKKSLTAYVNYVVQRNY